jgi:hypothetical protein
MHQFNSDQWRLAGCLCQAYDSGTFDWSNISEGTEGSHHVARKASFKAKASEQSPAGIGGGWVIVVAGERRIRGTRRTGSGYANAKHRRDSRNHSR